MTRLIVGPFNRVEGDLELTLDIADGRIEAARVATTLYRGFEQILVGRPAADALVIAPRICGICSLSQSMAAAAALRGLTGVRPPRNGELAANIAHAAENIADHFTHFYLFFMPDFAREAYAGKSWFPAAQARFKAVSGAAAQDALPARARLLHVLGLIAGKWPHSLAIQPGGVTRALDLGEKMRLISAHQRIPRLSGDGCFSPRRWTGSRRCPRRRIWRRWPKGRAISPPSCASPRTCGWTIWAGSPCR